MCWHNPAVWRICLMKAKIDRKQGKTGGASAAVFCCDICRWLGASRIRPTYFKRVLLGVHSKSAKSKWELKMLKESLNIGKEGKRCIKPSETSDKICFLEIYVLYILICIKMYILYTLLLFWYDITITKYCVVMFIVLKKTGTHTHKPRPLPTQRKKSLENFYWFFIVVSHQTSRVCSWFNVLLVTAHPDPVVFSL